MELLDRKLSLIKEIYLVTESLLKASLDERYEELNNLLEQRQSLMNQVDDIDIQIRNEDSKANYNMAIVEEQVQDKLKQIIEIDNRAKKILSNKELEIRRKFYEIDKKIKTGNYDVLESEQKPKGYYLNTKS